VSRLSNTPGRDGTKFLGFIEVPLCLYFALAHDALAQDSGYVYKPKQQQVQNDEQFTSPNCNKAKALDELLGEKVVFVTQTKRFQRFGYQSYHWLNNRSASVPYDALAGKVGTIVEIQPRSQKELNFRHIVIKLDSDESVTTEALDDQISDITLLSDIQEGRRRWIGKTLWYQSKYIRPATDAEVIDSKTVLKYQPIKIADVMVGANLSGSIDFVIQFNNGQEGLADVKLSASNTSPKFLETLRRLERKECGFDSKFLLEDPRLTHKWAPTIWSAIERDEVLVGMTIDQVIMAWGRPNEINSTETKGTLQSQWVYGERRYVYIDQTGKVTAIQQ
jgi:hypothetical protein